MFNGHKISGPMEQIKIKSKDAFVSITEFGCANPKALLIIASATGVKQGYYHKFAQFIASHEIIVITFDYTGIGRSLNGPIKALHNNARDWGQFDLDGVINYAINRYPDLRKSIIGHSIGGQLIGLSKASLQLDKVILVAAQSGYWGFWRGFAKVKMWFNWYLLFPALINLFGFFPGKKLGVMENLPKEVTKQWSKWGRHKDYLLSEIPVEQTVYHKLNSDFTAYSIDDDRFAPKKAVDWMCDVYTNAKFKRIHLDPKDFNTNSIGHFGIFRERFKESLWIFLLDEVMTIAEASK